MRGTRVGEEGYADAPFFSMETPDIGIENMGKN